MTVNWRRSATPMLPYITSPQCSARPNSRDGAPLSWRAWFSASTRARASREAASAAAQAPSSGVHASEWLGAAADGKDRKDRVADIAEDFAVMVQHSTGRALEKIVQ